MPDKIRALASIMAIIFLKLQWHMVDDLAREVPLI